MAVTLLIPENNDMSVSAVWLYTLTHGCVRWVNPNLNSDNDEALIGVTLRANRAEPDGDTALLM